MKNTIRNLVSRVVAAQVIALSSVLAFPEKSVAAPFRLNSGSFQSYLNALNWGSGKRVTFSSLHNCNPIYSSVVDTSHPSMVQYERYNAILKAEAEAGYTADQSRVPGLQQWQIENRYPVRLIYQAVMENDWKFKSQFKKQVLASYYCSSGYVRIVDPRGQQNCATYVTWDANSRGSSYTSSGCRWN